MSMPKTDHNPKFDTVIETRKKTINLFGVLFSMSTKTASKSAEYSIQMEMEALSLRVVFAYKSE